VILLRSRLSGACMFTLLLHADDHLCFVMNPFGPGSSGLGTIFFDNVSMFGI
jgi:hypothetical protein